MIGYAVTDVFTPRAVQLRSLAQLIIIAAPDSIGDKPVRCHELARAVGAQLNLPVHDGKYGHIDHSWCTIPSERAILDVYSIGRLPQVQLIDCSGLMPEFRLYRSDVLREDIRMNDLRELLKVSELTMNKCRGSKK